MSAEPTESHTRIWSPRTWSLRLRLLVTQVVLLAAVCAIIGVATELALERFLMRQLDQQLVEAGTRSAVIFELPPLPPDRFPPFPDPPNAPPYPRERFDPEFGPGPRFLNAPGQAARTVGAVISPSGAIDAGVINADATRSAVDGAAAAKLARVPATRTPTTVDLGRLGRYRVIALHARHSDQVIVTGLPTAVLDDTLWWVLGMFCILAVIALLAAAIAGMLIIRRQLAPLSRVATAARDVADLELDKGEVCLPSRIVRVDPAGAHTEVGQLGTALNRMLDRVASALSARHASETRVRQFVADASHELRTPLAAIRGYTELAQRKRHELPDDVAHAMSRVESETERMTHLVEDLLLLARLDAGRPLVQESVDVSRLVVDAVSDAHVAGADHDWALDLPEEPVAVVGDEARLQQVLVNLLANARVHTPPGTAVTTSLVQDGDMAVLTVADDGPGIPADLLPEVFERFSRGDSSRSRRGVAPATTSGHGVAPATTSGHGVAPATTSGHGVAPATTSGHGVAPATTSGHGVAPATTSGHGVAPATTSGHGGSTGLGLSIVAAVVKAHDGTIAVRSVPGETEFVVRLPRHPTTSQPAHSPNRSDA